jgi:hypothetical protein
MHGKLRLLLLLLLVVALAAAAWHGSSGGVLQWARGFICRADAGPPQVRLPPLEWLHESEMHLPASWSLCAASQGLWCNAPGASPTPVCASQTIWLSLP